MVYKPLIITILNFLWLFSTTHGAPAFSEEHGGSSLRSLGMISSGSINSAGDLKGSTNLSSSRGFLGSGRPSGLGGGALEGGIKSTNAGGAGLGRPSGLGGGALEGGIKSTNAGGAGLGRPSGLGGGALEGGIKSTSAGGAGLERPSGLGGGALEGGIKSTNAGRAGLERPSGLEGGALEGGMGKSTNMERTRLERSAVLGTDTSEGDMNRSINSGSTDDSINEGNLDLSIGSIAPVSITDSIEEKDMDGLDILAPSLAGLTGSGISIGILGLPIRIQDIPFLRDMSELAIKSFSDIITTKNSSIRERYQQIRDWANQYGISPVVDTYFAQHTAQTQQHLRKAYKTFSLSPDSIQQINNILSNLDQTPDHTKSDLSELSKTDPKVGKVIGYLLNARSKMNSKNGAHNKMFKGNKRMRGMSPQGRKGNLRDHSREDMA